MKILSIRRGFLADHSSTSYDFLAVDKPLTAKDRATMSKETSEVNSRRAHFFSYGEGCMSWEPLMRKYYDVMYSESYDWWTLAISFKKPKAEFIDRLKEYEFRGDNDLGVDIENKGRKIIIAIYCTLDAADMITESYYDDYEEYDDEEIEEEDSGPIKECNDELLNLLIKVRSCVMKGHFHPLYAVWEEYGHDDEDAPPKPKANRTAANVAKKLAAILTNF